MSTGSCDNFRPINLLAAQRTCAATTEHPLQPDGRITTAETAAVNGATAIAGMGVVVVSPAADRHAALAHEIAPGLASGQILPLRSGYIGGSTVFVDAQASAGAPGASPPSSSATRCTLLESSINPSAVVIKGQKRWLELARLLEAKESPTPEILSGIRTARSRAGARPTKHSSTRCCQSRRQHNRG